MNRPETYTRVDGLYGWRLRNMENGSIVATDGGQGFTERNDAAEAVKRVIADAAHLVLDGLITTDILGPDLNVPVGPDDTFPIATE